MKSQRKPEWVTKEIVRLKAFMPNEGCRKIAETFNRIHCDKRQMTVGKSFVYYTIRKHSHEIRMLRKLIRKRPRTYPKNFIWSMDLTQVKDRLNNLHNLFGIVDSGTRACLFLNEVKTKASITLLRCLLDTIEQFGKPAAIRTDNESVFTSRLFRFCLWLLQIKHQRTRVCSPWQNGRIERFFGTLKRKLALYDLDEIGFTQDLAIYRFWYNHVRTHQYLNGKTPAEAWDAKEPGGKPIEFSAWDGGRWRGFSFPHPNYEYGLRITSIFTDIICPRFWPFRDKEIMNFSPALARKQEKNAKKGIIFGGRSQIFKGKLQKSGNGTVGLA